MLDAFSFTFAFMKTFFFLSPSVKPLLKGSPSSYNVSRAKAKEKGGRSTLPRETSAVVGRDGQPVPLGAWLAGQRLEIDATSGSQGF